MRAYELLQDSAIDDLAKKLTSTDKSTMHELLKNVAARHEMSDKALHALFLRKYGRDPFKLKSHLEEDGGGRQQQIRDFIQWTFERLNIQQPYPKITLSQDNEKAQEGHHTGLNIPADNTIWVYIGNRNLVDLFRTIFHEVTHVKQNQLGRIGPNDSYPGSPIEMVADAMAGIAIKLYAKEHPEIIE